MLNTWEDSAVFLWNMVPLNVVWLLYTAWEPHVVRGSKLDLCWLCGWDWSHLQCCQLHIHLCGYYWLELVYIASCIIDKNFSPDFTFSLSAGSVLALYHFKTSCRHVITIPRLWRHLSTVRQVLRSVSGQPKSPVTELLSFRKVNHRHTLCVAFGF